MTHDTVVRSAREALGHPDVLVVAARADGAMAVRRGLPASVSPADLSRAVVADQGPPPSVAVALRPGADDEVAAQLGRFQDPRTSVLGLEDPQPVLGAVGYASWLARTRHCVRCGSELDLARDHRVLECPRCGHEAFPRLEPAVIMRVVDADDRLLLARQRVWPEGRFSVLAGFVEPGEDLETTVRREVAEEVGVQIGDVSYVASQPWPFPASLMLGFEGRAETISFSFDDGEIVEARWLTREALGEAMAAGTIGVPPAVSIAHRLIEEWYGGELVHVWSDRRR